MSSFTAVQDGNDTVKVIIGAYQRADYSFSLNSSIIRM